MFSLIAYFEFKGHNTFFGEECQTEVVICLIMLQGPTFVLLDSFIECSCLLASGVLGIESEYERCYVLCYLNGCHFCLIAL